MEFQIIDRGFGEKFSVSVILKCPTFECFTIVLGARREIESFDVMSRAISSDECAVIRSGVGKSGYFSISRERGGSFVISNGNFVTNVSEMMSKRLNSAMLFARIFNELDELLPYHQKEDYRGEDYEQ
jgi:hypothetical protein